MSKQVLNKLFAIYPTNKVIVGLSQSSNSVPVDKKWNELIKYNIFIMKLVEFGLSFIIMILPALLTKPKGHMYCIATGPTFVISLLLVILYVRKKVPIFMEKLYLCFQIAFVFGAFVQCFILNLLLGKGVVLLVLLSYKLTDRHRNAGLFGTSGSAWNQIYQFVMLQCILPIILKVISLALMVVPFMVSGTTTWHCLAVAPTLVLSLLFIILYLVDQVHDLAEQSYLIIQIICNVLAVITGLLSNSATLALIGLLNCHLIFILTIDLYYITRERGFALAKLK